MSVYSSAATTFVGAFPTLTHVDHLYLGSMNVPNLEGFGGLEFLADLEVNHMPALQSLDGIAGVSAQTRVYVSDCPELSDLGAFRGVSDVQSLTLHRAGRLTDLSGLEELVHVGELFIFENPLLTNLRALSSLEGVEGSLYVVDNPALPSCEADWLRSSIGDEAIGGTIDLSGNAGPGTCN